MTTTPHKTRTTMIKTILLCLLLAIVLASNWSCTANRYGCRQTWGASGYNPKTR